MSLSDVMTSEINSLSIYHLWIFSESLVHSAIAVDKEKSIPIVVVYIIKLSTSGNVIRESCEIIFPFRCYLRVSGAQIC
jgi:hypothetical protein